MDFSYSENLAASADDTTKHIVSLQFTGNKAVDIEHKQAITDALQKGYPKNSFEEESSTAVDASKGANFFLKCIIAVSMSAIIMILYVALRFRKIGGFSAGVMAVVALIHDLDNGILCICTVPYAAQRQLHRRCSYDTRLLTQ